MTAHGGVARARSTARSPGLDGLRGLACVVMIIWHTADAWLEPTARETVSFARLRVFGGLAAPWFFFAAGVSLGLTTPPSPDWRKTTSSLVRALGIVLVGYAVALLSWTLDYGAVCDPRNNGPVLLLAWPAMGLCLSAFRTSAGTSRRNRLAKGAVGLAGLVFAYAHLEGATHRPSTLLRLDVLHGIGAAVAVVAMVLQALGQLGSSARTRTAWLSLLALGVALATPWLREASFERAPPHIVDWVVAVRGAQWPSGARFPLFPWSSHALLGAAAGSWLQAHAAHIAQPSSASTWLLVALTLLAAGALEPMPLASFVIEHAEWSRDALRAATFAVLAGCASAWAAVLERNAPRIVDAIQTLGRRSLAVYVVHLECSYGLLGWPLHRSLGWTGWLLSTAALLAAMVRFARWLESRDPALRTGAVR